jgi:hypothetical protein
LELIGAALLAISGCSFPRSGQSLPHADLLRVPIPKCWAIRSTSKPVGRSGPKLWPRRGRDRLFGFMATLPSATWCCWTADSRRSSTSAHAASETPSATSQWPGRFSPVENEQSFAGRSAWTPAHGVVDGAGPCGRHLRRW